MTRNRVRRPFAVEVKQRGRSAAGQADPQTPAGLWGTIDLAEEPVRPPVSTKMTTKITPPRIAAPAMQGAGSAAPAALAKAENRRVLPSLIAPPPEPDTPPADEAEPRLPRVRRVVVRKATRTAAPAPRPEAAPPSPAPIELPRPAPLPPQVADGQARIVAPRSSRTRPGRTPESLRIGERWKRRLPRVCW